MVRSEHLNTNSYVSQCFLSNLGLSLAEPQHVRAIEEFINANHGMILCACLAANVFESGLAIVVWRVLNRDSIVDRCLT